MPVSDAVFEKFLKADGARRVLLVEASAYHSGALVTRYMADKPFVSGPTQTPANIAYDDLVKAAPSFSSRMSEQFGGRAAGGWGDLQIDNSNGDRDGWLDDAWDGRAVRLYIGASSWPRDDFRRLLDGVGADIVSRDNATLTLRLRDKTWMSNVGVQTAVIGGATANANKTKPLCFGDCFNVTPVLVTAATHEYQVHDGAINDIPDVRDNGVTVGYTKDLTNGKFTLTAAPAGQLTCDVQGAKVSGTYITKCADIIQHILTTRTLLTTGDLDTSAFSAMNTTCPQTLGLYIAAGEFRTVNSVVDELVTSVGGFWEFTLDGLMTLGRFDAPAGTPVMALSPDDLVQNGLRLVQRIPPVLSYSLLYRKNWTPQRSGMAGAVTEANRALYAAPGQTKSVTNAGIDATFKLAIAAPQVDTLLADGTEAATECSRRATLWGSLRYRYEGQGFAAALGLRLGQVVSITYPRFGLDAGALTTVIARTWSPTLGRTALEVFA
jgi:hypothetical protein